MVVVKLELWPGGDESRKRKLGELRIANDGTGTAENGNYNVELKHSGRYVNKPGNWRTGRVLGFTRDLSPYHLLVMALNACRVWTPD